MKNTLEVEDLELGIERDPFRVSKRDERERTGKDGGRKWNGTGAGFFRPDTKRPVTKRHGRTKTRRKPTGHRIGETGRMGQDETKKDVRQMSSPEGIARNPFKKRQESESTTNNEADEEKKKSRERAKGRGMRGTPSNRGRRKNASKIRRFLHRKRAVFVMKRSEKKR